MIPQRMSRVMQGVLALVLALSCLFPAPAFAQEPGIPAGATGDEVVVDVELPEGAEAAVVEEITETPTTIVSGGADSYDVANPGLYWLTESTCAPVPPNVAAAEGESSVAGDNPPTEQQVDPAAVEAATDFLIRRTTVSGYDTRVLQQKVDNSGPPDYYCPNQYKVNSNVVADQAHVYWVDDNGLVRVPVTANAADTPEVVDANWKADDRVDLKMVGTRLFGTDNHDARITGQIILPGSSSLRMYDTASGASSIVTSSVFANYEYNSPQFDGTYVFYKESSILYRVNLDGSGKAQVASNVGVYHADGRRFQICVIGQPCTNTHYVFYVIYSGGTSVIYRRNLEDNTVVAIQTRLGSSSQPRFIHSLIVTSMPGILQLGARRIFWMESVYVPFGGEVFGGTMTWSLMRSTLGSGGTISNLYNVQDTTIYQRAINDLRSNGEFLFWRDQGVVRRLPLDAAALPKVNMRVTGLEITQGVQDDANSTRIVQGRQTWVRVFVKSDGVNVPNVFMTLTSSEGGTVYPSSANFMTVKGSPNKNALGDSFLFLLPTSWTDQANLRLYAHLNPLKIPFEPDYSDNEYTSPLFTLSTPYPMTLVLYPASYALTQNGATTAYAAPRTAEHFSRIMRSYPLAENGLTMRVRNIAGGTALGTRVQQTHADCLAMSADSRSLCAAEWLYAKIFLAYLFPDIFSGSFDEYHYGLIADELQFPRGRVLDVGFPLGAGPGSNSGAGDFGYYTAHEVAHELNRNHPTPNGDNSSTTAVEGCGHSRSDNSYPYANAFIGPADGSVRGFDRAQPTGSGSQVAIYTDSQSYDVMSYCGNAQLRWPSPYTWEGLYTWLRDTSTAQAAAMLAGPTLAVAGSLHGDVLTVLDVRRSDNGMEMGTMSGAAWTLRQLDGSNNVLASHNFAIEDDGEGGLFGVAVPFHASAQTLQILAPGGAVKWSQTVSSHAPVVSNVTLAAATSPITGMATLSWQAEDGDGDTLTYDIHYSVDGGAHWQPVLFDVETSNVSIDTDTLPGGSARFRVLASDGVNTGYADSADSAVMQKGPQIELLTPALGDHFNWRETVPLSVYALDLKDGTLDGASIVWSNQFGVLGTGAYLATASLPTGANAITVKATNSAGLYSSKSITIYIDDALEGPEATLVAAPTSLNFQVDLETTTTQVQSLQLDYIGASGAISWTASSDAPWLTLDTQSGSSVPATINVSVNPTGLPGNFAHRATITIEASPVSGTPHTVEVPVVLAIGNTMFSATGSEGLQTRTFLPAVTK